MGSIGVIRKRERILQDFRDAFIHGGEDFNVDGYYIKVTDEKEWNAQNFYVISFATLHI
jgi:hypothetical protein